MLFYFTEVWSSSLFECFFLSVDRVFLFSADGGHPATKRQRSKIAAVAIPANHSGHSDRWNLVPPLLVPLYPSVLSFVLEGHQIQSAECLSFRGAEKTAFILLSLWPYIKALELEESTMGEKASQGHCWKMAAFWRRRGVFPSEFEWIWMVSLKSL